jgi:hypothetical protein
MYKNAKDRDIINFHHPLKCFESVKQTGNTTVTDTLIRIDTLNKIVLSQISNIILFTFILRS